MSRAGGRTECRRGAAAPGTGPPGGATPPAPRPRRSPRRRPPPPNPPTLPTRPVPRPRPPPADDAVKRFEDAPNKPVAGAYIAAAAGAILGAEYFMHLPLFNFLIGFPVQLVGLLVTPYLVLRYYEGEDPVKDVEGVYDYILKKLPGLDK